MFHGLTKKRKNFNLLNRVLKFNSLGVKTQKLASYMPRVKGLLTKKPYEVFFCNYLFFEEFCKLKWFGPGF